MILFLMFVFSTYHSIVFSSSLETSDNEQVTERLEFLVTNKSEIWRVRNNGDKYRYITNTTAIGDVDYHLEKNLLFWIDAERREIHSQSLDINSTAFHMIFKQLRNWEPVALAIDFVGDKIYVADISGIKIDVFELDGRYHSIVLGTDLVRPLDIKLDPYEALMFVLDGYRIIRSSMDGNSLVSIIRPNIRTLYGISIDVQDKKVYWIKNSDLQIMSSDYSGEKIKTVENNVPYPTWSKFSAFNKSIIWANEYIQYKSECHDEKLKIWQKSIYRSNPKPSIRILHSSISESTTNPCANNNGGCQHMCILGFKNNNSSEITSQCTCNVGWALDENLKNCTRVKDFLMYTQTSVLKSHLINNSMRTSREPYLPISGEKSKFKDFDYHFADNYMYYIVTNPLKVDAIYRVHPNESELELFLRGDHENYNSLAIDWATSYLYYTDPLKGLINVANIKNVSEKLLILERLEHPDNIVIHPNKGFIFFFQTNETTKISIFSRAQIDGSNLTTFNDFPLKKHCGFTLDLNEDRIYWFEWRKKSIKHSNLNFTDVQDIQSELTKYIYSISIYEKWIYVVTSISEGLWRFDKKNNQFSELILADITNRITKVKVFSSEIQHISSEHPCNIDNGRCLDFCSSFLQNTSDSRTKVCADRTEDIFSEENNKTLLTIPP